MKYCKIFTFICVVTYFCVSSVFSESHLSETGKTGVSFLTIAPSSQIASLGGNACALNSGASSSWSNPSLIAFQEEKSAQFTHIDWIEDIKHEFAAFSTKFDYGSLGLGVQLFDSGDIDGRSGTGQYVGVYDIRNVALSVTYANMPTDWLALGLTYKKIFQKISQETAGGYAVDFGFTARTPVKGLSVAAAGRNYGRMGKLKNERTELPSNISIGCVYANFIPGIERSHLVLADVIIPKYGDNGVRLGAEVETVENLVFRVGYRNDSYFEDVSFGAGFKWEIVSADISYSPMSGISDDAIRFTLSLTGF